VCTGYRHQQGFVDHVYSFLGFSNYAQQIDSCQQQLASAQLYVCAQRAKLI